MPLSRTRWLPSLTVARPRSLGLSMTTSFVSLAKEHSYTLHLPRWLNLGYNSPSSFLNLFSRYCPPNNVVHSSVHTNALVP